MKTILVTGGAGFIGGCFVRMALNRHDVCIINLDKLTYAGNFDSLESVVGRKNHVFVQGDICDAALLSELFESHRPGAIVNFAAESHVDRSIDGPAAFVATNVVGTFTLLEQALRFWKQLPAAESAAFRFVQVSTDEVYGSLGPTGAFSETNQYRPSSPYSASKAAADHFVRAYHKTYGLPVLTTNCSNNYGPYQFPEKLIPLVTLNAIEGRPLPIYGDGLQSRDWLYVEDHCRAISALLERGQPGQVYNIGGNCERTNLDIVSTICRTIDGLLPDLPHAPSEQLITHVTDRPGHDRRYAIDAAKIRDSLGWEPLETFETGIQKTVQWCLENRAWLRRITSGAYRRERRGLG